MVTQSVTKSDCNGSTNASAISATASSTMKIRFRNKILPTTEDTLMEKIVQCVALSSLCLYSFVILFGEYLFLSSSELDWCQAAILAKERKTYENPDFDSNPCRNEHVIQLLYLSINECDYARRMLVSVILGAMIGLERKSRNRNRSYDSRRLNHPSTLHPGITSGEVGGSSSSGIRTMGLVSLGSCLFTISGMIAFRHGSTMGWDSARVSAAIPSGVGFLGAALIWKGESASDSSSTNKNQSPPQVHGLTTAASVWLSAALGMAVGGHQYVVSIYVVILVILILRLGAPTAGPLDQKAMVRIVDSGHGYESDLNDDWEMDSEQDNISLSNQIMKSKSAASTTGGNGDADSSCSSCSLGRRERNANVVSQEEQIWLLEQNKRSNHSYNTALALSRERHGKR